MWLGKWSSSVDLQGEKGNVSNQERELSDEENVHVYLGVTMSNWVIGSR
jgi:hypothetical protein